MRTALQIVCMVAAFGGLYLGFLLLQDFERKSRAKSPQVKYTIAILLLFGPAVLAYQIMYWLLIALG